MTRKVHHLTLIRVMANPEPIWTWGRRNTHNTPFRAVNPSTSMFLRDGGNQKTQIKPWSCKVAMLGWITKC